MSGPWTKTWFLGAAQTWTSPWPLATSMSPRSAFPSHHLPLQLCLSPYSVCLSIYLFLSPSPPLFPSLPFSYPVLTHHNGARPPGTWGLGRSYGHPPSIQLGPRSTEKHVANSSLPRPRALGRGWRELQLSSTYPPRPRASVLDPALPVYVF